LVLASVVGCVGCESQAADLREWRPGDHDHTEQPGRDQVSVADGGPQNPLAAHGISDVVLVAWRQKCVRCHGTIGRGDGPQASMYAPPDLSDEKRQAALTDPDIHQLIRAGRGKMPAFDLPDSTLEGLVKLVRLIGGGPEPAAAASGAPPGSAAPVASGTAQSPTAPHPSPGRPPSPSPSPATRAGGTGAATPPSSATP
jgi:hypothetical protein